MSAAAPAVLRFHYHEVMDRDFTLIRVEVIEDGAVTHLFTNLPETWQEAPRKEAYANQREDFVFPSGDAALGIVRSNPAYREMTPALKAYFTAEEE